MTATPTSVAQLLTALDAALPTRYRPCVPAPTRDGKIHISTALTGAYTPNTPTTTLCGEAAVVMGSAIIPSFVICETCWSLFVNR